MFKCVCCGKEIKNCRLEMCKECLDEYSDLLIDMYSVNKKKAKVIGIAWASPVKRLPIGAVVDVIDKINDVNILVRYKGFNYIIKESSVRYIEEAV